MVHRVAPSGPREEAEVRAAQWRDAASRFHLAEAHVVGCNYDIARQHHFYTNCVGDALHRRHDRLHRTIAQCEGVEALGTRRSRARARPEEFRYVEAGGEVLALRRYDGYPPGVIAIEFRQRIGKLLHHLGCERVPLGDVVDDDSEDAPVALMPNVPGFPVITHSESPSLAVSFCN